jgi:hypothetical protein
LSAKRLPRTHYIIENEMERQQVVEKNMKKGGKSIKLPVVCIDEGETYIPSQYSTFEYLVKVGTVKDQRSIWYL